MQMHKKNVTSFSFSLALRPAANISQTICSTFIEFDRRKNKNLISQKELKTTAVMLFSNKMN